MISSIIGATIGVSVILLQIGYLIYSFFDSIRVNGLIETLILICQFVWGFVIASILYSSLPIIVLIILAAFFGGAE